MSPHPAATRTVLITGASSGIGRATALHLAERGAQVILLSRSAEVLEEVREECEQLGARAHVVPADVGDRASVTEAFATAQHTAGRLDAVVHCAASLAYGRFEDVPAEVFDRAVQTTLLGTANVARCSLEAFHSSGAGSLVVVGSLLGKMSTPYMSSYVTSKWGVHGLVRTLQIEARQTPGVDISLVWPGGVNTPVYLQAGTYLRRHGRPPPPVDSPEKVARAIAEVLDQPVRERSVGALNHLTVAGFRAAPAVFDRVVTPLMRLGGLSRGEVDNTAGNVLNPLPAGEAVHGPWSRAVGSPHKESIMEHHDGVVTISRDIEAPGQAVWDALADGWLYATWVVGASRVREVDDGWPAEGTRIHHSVGLWPALINDTTNVLASTEPTELVLRAKGWPAGEAKVVITISPRGTDACTVQIQEDASSGPGTLIPKPVRQLGIGPRNVEALRRLAYLAEGRHRERIGTD